MPNNRASPQPRAIDTMGSAINGDVPCANCRYNLRGLRPSALCPECGCPIIRSLAADVVWLASSGWLRMQAVGLLGAAASMSAACWLAFQTWTIARPGTVTVMVAWVMCLLTFALPDDRRRRGRVSTRWSVALVAAALLNVVGIIILLMHDQAAAPIALLLGALTAAVTLRHAATLANRLPEPFMARLLTRIAWLVAISFLPWWPLRVLLPRAGEQLLPYAQWLVLIGVPALYLGMLVSLFLAMELLYLSCAPSGERRYSHPAAHDAPAARLPISHTDTCNDG